ncbi:hypothetical protein PoB_005945100 [Plakobranchus ocellatus]|uniref:Uncharacterized protein n=1 Tax=Plakobranchus ocellatus TaxID=259542 RepID=A0AAV4CJ83_9GAST|nr:hypothetical protein PoB_005945100 [Plakobranchus ocellatus]
MVIPVQYPSCRQRSEKTGANSKPNIHQVHTRFEAILERYPTPFKPTFQGSEHGFVHQIVLLDPECLNAAASKIVFRCPEKLGVQFETCAEKELHASVDEQIIPFKSRHSLTVYYMLKNPKKWGNMVITGTCSQIHVCRR